MSLYIIAFTVSCLLIFVFGIISHVGAVQREKGDCNTQELRSYKKDAKKRLVLALGGLLLFPLVIPAFEYMTGNVIPLIILLVVFFELCLSLVVVSQGHRFYLVLKELRRRETR